MQRAQPDQLRLRRRHPQRRVGEAARPNGRAPERGVGVKHHGLRRPAVQSVGVAVGAGCAVLVRRAPGFVALHAAPDAGVAGAHGNDGDNNNQADATGTHTVHEPVGRVGDVVLQEVPRVRFAVERSLRHSSGR